MKIISFKILIFCTVRITIEAAKLNGSCYLKDFKATNERIQAHGYPTESHYVETSDGYVLNVFRIPYSHKLQNQNEYRPVILLQHGLFSNSDCWLSSGPDNSLAYLLADAGYDVWLGNARGNIYSRNNTKISLNHPKFWSFDWHEIGTIDIAAMIDYIIATTGHSRIHYAGHSQGTTVYLVLMSERPEYNHKIKSAHMLAPCAYFKYADWYLFKALAPLIGNPKSFYTKVLENIELLPQNDLINRIVDSACGVDPQFGFICKNLYFLFVGDGYTNVNTTSLQILLETHPAGSSSNQVIHYIQQYVSHKFRKYDWGEKKNMLLYGQETPPEYNLSKISAPVYLYSGKNDALCNSQNVDLLVRNLPYLVKDHRVPDPTFNHLDFIIGHNIRELVNIPIMENMLKHEKRNIANILSY